MLTPEDVRATTQKCDCCTKPATSIDQDKALCDYHEAHWEPFQHFSRCVIPRSQLANLPPYRFAVEGLKPFGTNISVGAFGTMKSFSEIGLALCVATGTTWFGRNVVQMPALYIIGEGASGIHQRVTAWEETYYDNQRVDDALFSVVAQPTSLANQATWAALSMYAKQRGFRYIVIDTLSSTAPDADETKDAAVIMSQMSALAVDVNGAVTLVHHAGWAEKGRARGGSQLECNADAVLVYTSNDRENHMASLTVKKQKDGPSGEVICIQGQQVTLTRLLDTDGDPVNTLVVRVTDSTALAGPLRKKILAALDLRGGEAMTSPELMQEVGAAKATFYDALRRLQEEGEITRETDSRGRVKRGGLIHRTQKGPDKQP